MGGSSLSAKRWTAADAPSLVRPAAALAGAGERGSSSSSLSRHREESSDFSLHRPSPNAEILRSARREASSRRLNARSSTAGDVLGRLAVDDDGAGVEAEVGAGAGSFFGSARRRSLRRGYSYGGDEDIVAKQDSVNVAHRRQAVATAAAAANREADWREAEIGRLRSSTPRGRTSTFTSTSTSMSTSPPLPPPPPPPPRNFMSNSLRRKVETSAGAAAPAPRRSSTPSASSSLLPARLGSSPSVPGAVARGSSTRGREVGGRGTTYSTYGNDTLSSIRRRDAQARRVQEAVGEAPPRRARTDTSKFY